MEYVRFSIVRAFSICIVLHCNGSVLSVLYFLQSAEQFRLQSLVFLSSRPFSDLRDLFRSIQDDSKCGFSFATFIRQATNARKEWLHNVCVRGRLCVPPSHWHRNIFSQPVAEAEVPADVALEFEV